MIAVVRSVMFYCAFYLGSVFLVLAALAVLPFSAGAFRAVVEGWSKYHRLCARWLLGIRIVREGTMPGKPVLYAIKHESFLEAIDLPALLGRSGVFAKAELLRIPLWGKVGAAAGLIGVERDQGAKALRVMIAAARVFVGKGQPLAIFPEGTRVRHGQRPGLQSGFAGLYKLLGLPVVPVAVNSGPLYHRRWKRSGTVTFRFCEEIPPGLPREEIEGRIREAINRLNAPEAS